MIQSQNYCIQSEKKCLQSIDRLETKMSHLVKTINDRNEKTQPNILLTILNFPNHIDLNQESWCFGDFNQDSIPPQHLKLDNPKP